MRHKLSGRRFGVNSSHHLALFRNLATSLFKHEKIETTDQKCKELRIFAERLITLAKRGDLSARRQAHRDIHQQDVLAKLFNDIGPRFKTRPGGYTRTTKVRFRKGDNALMSVIELVGSEKPIGGEKPAATADE